MVGIAEIEERIELALSRLHEIAAARGAMPDDTAEQRWSQERAELSDRVTMLDRDCEILREECDRLRREVDLGAELRLRLEQAVATAETRLGAAVADLDELLEG